MQQQIEEGQQLRGDQSGCKQDHEQEPACSHDAALALDEQGT